jgi:ribosomal protein S18 acetylase RimI-like enzyme
MDFKFIEEMSLNHWPSLSTLLYDGWVLRFSEGLTKRANSVNPIYDSSPDVNEKIRVCENLYSAHQLPSVFKITPFVQPPQLDETLADRGYALMDTVSVQAVNLDHIREPDMTSVTIDETLSSDWMDHFCRFNNVGDKDRSVMERMLSLVKTKTGFISLCCEDRIVACGRGVIERDYIGIYEVVTDPSCRNRGFGEQMMLNLLKWGKENGATHSYLQVVAVNEPALRLYAKIGYSEIYKYWYRVKDCT